MLTKGVRNNNPGNIIATPKWASWRGADDIDGRFIVFKEPIFGIRALAKILYNYNKNYGINTITGIVNRWAPSVENNTSNYIGYMTAKTGYKANQVLDMTNDAEVMFKLVNAIIGFENSNYVYDAELVRKAIEMAHTLDTI